MAYTFNPFTGTFDTIVKDGFLPWNYVASGTIVTVPQYRENNTVEELVVLGELVVNGLVALLGTPTWRYRAISADYTLVPDDELVNVTANTITVTLPTAVGFNDQFTIKNSGTGLVTLNTTSAQTVDGEASGVLTLSQYDAMTLRSDGANWIII